MIGISNTKSLLNSNAISKINSLNGTSILLLSSNWKASTKYTGYYEQVMKVSSITTEMAEYSLLSSNILSLPTEQEKTAFSLISNVVLDLDNIQIIFLSTSVPTTNVNLCVKGIILDGSIYNDNEIQQKINILVSAAMELIPYAYSAMLWQNKNTTAIFNGNQIILSQDIENFNYYSISYFDSINNKKLYSTNKIPINNTTGLSYQCYFVSYRDLLSIVKNVAMFGDASIYHYDTDEFINDNNYIIPYQIIGYLTL